MNKSRRGIFEDPKPGDTVPREVQRTVGKPKGLSDGRPVAISTTVDQEHGLSWNDECRLARLKAR